MCLLIIPRHCKNCWGYATLQQEHSNPYILCDCQHMRTINQSFSVWQTIHKVIIYVYEINSLKVNRHIRGATQNFRVFEYTAQTISATNLRR